MSASITILLLWAAFAATHMGLASGRLRPILVGRLGARGYGALYSVVALAIFVPLVGVYFDNKHSGPLLWYLGALPGVRWFMYAGMGVAFALMISGLVTPSPVSIMPGKAVVKGVFRISRHPLFMGVGLLGLLHLLVAPINTTELAFFAGFPLFSLAGCHHQDLRKLASLGDEFRRFHAATPFLPGGRRGALHGIAEQPVPMLAGVAVAAGIRYFHGSLFG
jgi:uncharacterized membrane protein